MSITLKIIGWVLMILAAMLEAANLALLASGGNWGLIAFAINSALWAGLFVVGFLLYKAGASRGKKTPQAPPPGLPQ